MKCDARAVCTRTARAWLGFSVARLSKAFETYVDPDGSLPRSQEPTPLVPILKHAD
jgi:hypothetical protein